jgi:hypothetical protein
VAVPLQDKGWCVLRLQSGGAPDREQARKQAPTPETDQLADSMAALSFGGSEWDNDAAAADDDDMCVRAVSCVHK